MTTQDPWYCVVDGEDLEQGDFIDRCPTFIPDYTPTFTGQSQQSAHITPDFSIINGEWQEYDVVVMSQSCDLQNDKLKFVLVCPYWSLEEFSEQNANFRSRKIREEIRRGYLHSLHMLNECSLEEKKQGIQIVEFGSVYSIPFDFLKHFAKGQGRRLRLLSPYKEQLSQAFARYFMRVGLPNDIPRF